MRVTITDVAKAAGVGKATVSRFLNDKGRVSEEAAERIRTAIDSMGYIPNSAARNLALKSSRTIGVLVTGFGNSYWSKLIDAFNTRISESADPHEIFILNCNPVILKNTDKSIRDKIQILLEQRVAGILLCFRDVTPEDIEYLLSQKVPFLLIQGTSADERVSYVNIDNYKASYDSARHLLKLGHTSIAYISGPTHALYAKERLDGFRDAMIAKKLYRQNMIFNGSGRYDDGYWRAKQILSKKQRPTAIMVATDEMAYGAMAAIYEAGLSIPEDISIIGFDGLREEIMMYSMMPPLTTVYQPMAETGVKAGETILQLIRDRKESKDSVYRVNMPTQLVDYGSCREI